MAGRKHAEMADRREREIGWGIRLDNGAYDLSGRDVKSYDGVVTLAELNAGKVLVPEVPGGTRKYKVLGFFIQFTGTFTTCTDMRLSDTAGSPVDILTIVVAQMGTGVIHTEGVGTHTLGAGFLADLTAGKGIQIRKTGSDAAGGTSITVRIYYRITA